MKDGTHDELTTLVVLGRMSGMVEMNNLLIYYHYFANAPHQTVGCCPSARSRHWSGPDHEQSHSAFRGPKGSQTLSQKPNQSRGLGIQIS